MTADKYSKKWDCFISYASEDREAIATPLAEALQKHCLRVWYDKFCLRVGDSLTHSINSGLADAKYGIVILSPSFFAKEWPQKELQGLFALESPDRALLLPVWHKIAAKDIRSTYPILADRVALSSSIGIVDLVRSLLVAMNLPFMGRGVAGTWIGKTGRLRLFAVGKGFIGDYDWNGREWVGHLSGRIVDERFVFQWHWDLGEEVGEGFFLLQEEMLARSYTSAQYQYMEGGWLLNSEPFDPAKLALGKLPRNRSWSFGRQIRDFAHMYESE
jgi:hypothetical protein